MKSRIIFTIGALFLVSVITIPAYAKSSYDQDGFTIFPNKSAGYMDGYRAGIIQAYKDVQLFNDGKIQAIDASY